MSEERETARHAQSILSGHEALYVSRAREALPLLVQLAEAGSTISYGRLAELMGIPNARNLNFILGSVGKTLQELSEQTDRKIPPLQALVTNRNTGEPGEGFDHFLKDWFHLRTIAPENRAALLKALQEKVLSYSRWDRVLTALQLRRASPVGQTEVPILKMKRGQMDGGESAAHLAFKQLIASNPQFFGMRGPKIKAEQEFPLPSGDVLDVLFTSPKRWPGVEVKAEISEEEDLVRGSSSV